MLNYNHLFYFNVAANEGSVAKAADRIGVTQPTVSEQIRTLERSLGVALFERNPTGLRLTEAGRIAFEHTRVMFRAGERLVQALKRDDAPRFVRIGVSGAVARATPSDYLLPLLAAADGVPSFRSGECADLLRDVRSGELDLAVVEVEPIGAARQGVTVAPVDTLALTAVVAPDVTPKPDWADLALVTWRAGSMFRTGVDVYLGANGLRPALAAETDDASFMLEAATRAGRVSFVPDVLARGAVAAGRVRVVATIEPAGAGVFAVTPERPGTTFAPFALQRA